MTAHALLSASGAVTYGHKTNIEAARTAYDALSAAQKAIVDGHATNNTAKLVAAEGGLTALETARGNLETAILGATAYLADVKTSDDGDGLNVGDKWATEDNKDIYAAAIEAATTASKAVDNITADVTDAIDTLANATTTFEGEVKTAP